MDSNLAVAVVGGFFGLVAAGIGFGVNELVTRRSLMKAQKGQRQRVRTLLRLEIEQNLEFVQDLLDQSTQPQEGSAAADVEQRLGLISLPAAPWHRVAWEQLIAQLPDVVSESTIRNLFGFYSSLEIITQLQRRMSEQLPAQLALEYHAWKDQIGPEVQPFEAAGDLSTRAHAFLSRTAADWHRAQTLLKELLENGNPLAENEGETTAKRPTGIWEPNIEWRETRSHKTRLR